MLDVLNADYVRTARAKGVPAAQGDLQARVPQRADPARHRRSRSTPRSCSAVSSSPSRSSRSRAWAGCSSTRSAVGDAPVLLGWFLVVAIFVIVFNLLADLLYGVLDPEDPVVSMTRHSRNSPRSSAARPSSSSAPGAEPVARTQLAAVPPSLLPPQAGAGRRSVVLVAPDRRAASGRRGSRRTRRTQTNLLDRRRAARALKHWFGTDQARPGPCSARSSTAGRSR